MNENKYRLDKSLTLPDALPFCYLQNNNNLPMNLGTHIPAIEPRLDSIIETLVTNGTGFAPTRASTLQGSLNELELRSRLNDSRQRDEWKKIFTYNGEGMLKQRTFSVSLPDDFRYGIEPEKELPRYAAAAA